MAIEKTSLNRCPICHSLLVDPYSNLSQVAQWLKEQGIIEEEIIISEENSDLRDTVVEALKTLQIYVWKHDPINTKRGLAGSNYKGLQNIYKTDIEDLQVARQEQELESNIDEAERTVFTSLGINTHIAKQHIRELRQSTEKLLGITSETSETDREVILEAYFNYDEDNNELGTQEYGVEKDNKKEWKRINRNLAGHVGEPYLPITKTDIHALDIEELRHPIAFIWKEEFLGLTPDTYNCSSSSYSRHTGSAHETQLGASCGELLDLSTQKTTQLQTRLSAEGSSGWNLDEGSGASGSRLDSEWGYNISFADGFIDFTISADVSGHLNIGAGNPELYGEAESSVNLNWITNKFINPSPHPKLRISSHRYLYFNLVNYYSQGEPILTLSVYLMDIDENTSYYDAETGNTFTYYIEYRFKPGVTKTLIANPSYPIYEVPLVEGLNGADIGTDIQTWATTYVPTWLESNINLYFARSIVMNMYVSSELVLDASNTSGDEEGELSGKLMEMGYGKSALA